MGKKNKKVERLKKIRKQNKIKKKIIKILNYTKPSNLEWFKI